MAGIIVTVSQSGNFFALTTFYCKCHHLCDWNDTPWKCLECATVCFLYLPVELILFLRLERMPSPIILVIYLYCWRNNGKRKDGVCHLAGGMFNHEHKKSSSKIKKANRAHQIGAWRMFWWWLYPHHRAYSRRLSRLDTVIDTEYLGIYYQKHAIDISPRFQSYSLFSFNTGRRDIDCNRALIVTDSRSTWQSLQLDHNTFISNVIKLC